MLRCYVEVYTLMHAYTHINTQTHTHTHAAHLYTKSLELCRDQNSSLLQLNPAMWEVSQSVLATP